MAPVTKTAAPAPKLPGPSDVELGDLSAQKDAAVAKIADLDDKLGRIDDALKNPRYADKKGELLALKKRFTAEKKTEVNKRDTAQKGLDAAFKKVGGGGAAKEVAGKEYDRLTEIDSQIAGTKAAQSDAIHAFSEATKAYEAAAKKYGILSPQAQAAEKKAVGAEKNLEQLDRKLISLDHAKAAMSGELKGTEQLAFDEAKKAGDASVKDVADFSQLSGTSKQNQLNAVGAPVVGVSEQQAVDGEVKRLSLASSQGAYRDDGAANAARLMTEQLKVASPEHQLALVKGAAAKGVLGNITGLAQQSDQAAGALLDTLKTTQGDAQRQLGIEVAKATTSMDSNLIKTLDAKMKNGDGFEEAYALEKGLRETGKGALADKVADLSRTRLGELTKAFEDKGAAVAAAKGDLARLMAGFGPLIPGEKQQAAVDAFKARHQAQFDAYDAAGGKLAHAAKFVMEHGSWNEKALEMMPDALATKEGQIAVNRALKDQAKGIKTFLDAGPEAMKDSTKVAKYLPQLLVKSVGQEALSLARAGRTAEAQKVLEGLKSNADLLGMDPKKVDKLTTSLKGVLDGKPDALKSFDTELRAAKPTEGVASMLKAVAWGASIINGVSRLSNNDDLKSMVKGSAEILGPTGEMAASTVEMLANSETALFKAMGESGAAANVKLLGKGLGAVGTGLGAALDAISAVQSFSKGNLVDGGISTLSAIGGATLAVDALGAAAGMQVVPVWGQVAGAALVIGATIGKWAWAHHEANVAEGKMEDDAKAYLQAAGIPEPIANELKDIKQADGRNVGMMIQQLAPAMGVDAKELFARVMKLPTDKLSDFIDMAKDLVIDDKGQIATRSQGHSDAAFIDTKYERYPGQDKGPSEKVEYHPQSLPNAVAWTKKFLKDNGV